MPPPNITLWSNTPLVYNSAGVWSKSFVQVFKYNSMIKRPVLKNVFNFYI
jgi:hypothetical protein